MNKLDKKTKRCKVQAVFSRFKKVRGEITDIPLYNIYGPSYLKH